MTFTDAQEMARPAFAQTRTPGLDAVAHVLQRAVTNEQNRLAAEIAKAEARCLDAENKAAALERDLAAAREREAKLRKAWAAFEERFGAWMDKQNEDVAFSSGMGFGKEYENVQAALAATQGEAA